MESSAEEQVGRDALIGEVLASRYRIEARLGGGGMGTVYRARHVKVGRPFAVKVMHRSLLADDRSRRRFQREAELAGTLRHANVVAVVDVGETPQGDRYIVMEFADGPPLTQLIEQGPIPGARMLRIAQQLCDGLEHAHERGMIHRDFKPDNIIVERDRDGAETPRIVDFGIAILRDEPEGGKHERLTTGGVVLGTPHCMAPEHACGEPIDHRIDLFALGVICFEMLTGRPPFDGDGVTVARANMMMETPPMGVRVPYLDVDPLLEAFTRKLMMKSRDARPPTAKAARDLLGLISRDRLAAAAALGVALASSNEPPASLAGAAGRRPGQDRAALAPETTRTAHPTELSLAARSPRKRLIAIGGAVCALAVTVAITMLVLQRSGDV